MFLIASMPAAALAACAALLLAVLTLWSNFRIWLAAVASTIVVGYIAGILHGPAALWLLALALAAWRAGTSRGSIRWFWIVVTAAVGCFLGLHALPGFSNPLLLNDAILATGARPYSQYINFDKTLAGVLFLGCSGWTPMRSTAEWRQALPGAAPIVPLTVVVVLFASLALGYVRFDPRWLPLFWIWATINLLTTCVSEEAFFRGLIQAEVNRVLEPRAAGWVAVIVSAVLFGLAHLAGGWRYVLLAALAGCGYAVVYQRTRRVEMSILTHFIVNATHFLLFTYPALA